MKRKTIAARLTPNVPAGIATIGIDGPQAVSVVLSNARLAAADLEMGRVHFGWWPLGALSSKLDRDTAKQKEVIGQEQIVVCRTEEQRIELHCHGGPAVCQAILSTLAEAGCEWITAEQWPYDTSCPIARAAERELLYARSDKAAAVLLDQWNGCLRTELVGVLGCLKASPHERLLREVVHRLVNLDRWSDFGCHLSSAWNVVFAGPPNVGKSSLINAMVGQTRSIVHVDAGTTRDWIESPAVIGGWPISLTDTAGIRQTTESIEREGVEKARQRVQQADLLVLVLDAGVGWTETHEQLSSLATAPKILCVNKIDLGHGSPERTLKLPASGDPYYLTSTLTEPGVEPIIAGIERALFAEVPEPLTAVPFQKQQQAAIREALHSIEQGHVQGTIETLEALLHVGGGG